MPQHGSRLTKPAFVYLHGMPGGPDELGLVTDAAQCFFAPDRTCAPFDDPKALAAEIAHRFPGQQVVLVGFSMGGFAALRLAPLLGAQLHHIQLIAAAAPLESGDYLAHMAGGPVFRMARDYPRLFGMLTRAQALMTRVAPDMLARQVFRSAQGGNVDLANDAAFRTAWGRIVRHCLMEGAQGYKAEVHAYVQPWAATVANVQTPVTLWQGDMDNWAPPAMADWLAANLPSTKAVRILPGCAHYSGLKEALAHILAEAE